MPQSYVSAFQYVESVARRPSFECGDQVHSAICRAPTTTGAMHGCSMVSAAIKNVRPARISGAEKTVVRRGDPTVLPVTSSLGGQTYRFFRMRAISPVRSSSRKLFAYATCSVPCHPSLRAMSVLARRPVVFPRSNPEFVLECYVRSNH